MVSETVVFDRHLYQEKVEQMWEPAMRRFRRIVSSFVLFNLVFLLIGAVEITFFLTSLAWLGESTVVAFFLALFFLTFFSYSVVRIYLQAKKPEYIQTLLDKYISSCKEHLHYSVGVPEHHMALASALQKFAESLAHKEYSFYAPSSFLASLAPTFEKFSAFCHWKDYYTLKEILLTHAIEEHIKVVICEPTHLEVHASLANSYVMLSMLYADPRKKEGYDEEKWISPERFSPKMRLRFEKCASRAIEEFKILHDYAPDDPWVHLQLAYSYRDLQMPQEEIKEYETLLHLRPDDNETLFKLGMLYFQQGKNSQGLAVFEKLKHTHPKKAESLIKFYGAYDFT